MAMLQPLHMFLDDTTAFAVQAIVGVQQRYAPTSVPRCQRPTIWSNTKHTMLRYELGNLEIKTTINVLGKLQSIHKLELLQVIRRRLWKIISR